MVQDWVFIINPLSGGGKGAKNWAKAKTVIDSQGLSYDYAQTVGPGHAVEMVKSRILSGHRRFCIVGGDGTMHEALNGIFAQKAVNSQEICLAMVPSGTGNDWARSHKIALKPEQSIAALRNGRAMLQDIGKIQYLVGEAEQQRYFINVAGLGYDAYVAEKFLARLKGLGKLSFMAAVVGGLSSYHNEEISVFADEFETNDRVFLFAIAINNYFGGGMKIAPDALPSDGLFDITLVGNISKWQVILQLKNLFDGSFVKHPLVKQMRTAKLLIESEKPLYLQADGELLGHTPFSIHCLPSAVQVISHKA